MRRLLLVVGLVSVACSRTTPIPAPAGPQRFGVAAFGDVDPLDHLATLRNAGCDYVEPALVTASPQ